MMCYGFVMSYLLSVIVNWFVIRYLHVVPAVGGPVDVAMVSGVAQCVDRLCMWRGVAHCAMDEYRKRDRHTEYIGVAL
ncbi:unnamed protein product [Toxocara canis]|uniref:G_PROTEIN_RECEP_F1_2 domain-containing protein n=1 Tax=Toxocara canis TaxID=6265 RepID=A0A183U186_TOXCA|nr:unnamed protein product [Toxocara canis]